MGYYDDDDASLTDAEREARRKDPIYEAFAVVRFLIWMGGSWKRVVGVLVLVAAIGGAAYIVWRHHGRAQPHAARGRYGLPARPSIFASAASAASAAALISASQPPSQSRPNAPNVIISSR